MTSHPETCRVCKIRVRQLLSELYGTCHVNHAFPWPSQTYAYTGTVVGEILEAMEDALKRYRGHEDFIKAPQMPPCDYYVPGVSLIVEFDERQHFTGARRLTLEHYQSRVPVGFSTVQWVDLCARIAAEDPDPPDRDERRAWYDALRDLLPHLHRFNPTVRIHSASFCWCSLLPDSKDDVQTFRALLPGLPDA